MEVMVKYVINDPRFPYLANQCHLCSDIESHSVFTPGIIAVLRQFLIQLILIFDSIQHLDSIPDSTFQYFKLS